MTSWSRNRKQTYHCVVKCCYYSSVTAMAAMMRYTRKSAVQPLPIPFLNQMRQSKFLLRPLRTNGDTAHTLCVYTYADRTLANKSNKEFESNRENEGKMNRNLHKKEFVEENFQFIIFQIAIIKIIKKYCNSFLKLNKTKENFI